MLGLQVLILGGLAGLAVGAPKTQALGANDYAKQAGKMYFGTAADLPNGGAFHDKYYMAQFNNTRDFGQATPANVMKWFYAEPKRGVFDFSLGDEFVRLAKANNYTIRCHNLLWHQEMPEWIYTANWTKATLLTAVEKRVKQTIAHYGDACYAWDVVNEAINDDGTYRKSVLWNVTGSDYIPVAYRTAQQTIAELGLKVKLYYNDYNIEYPGVKSAAVQNKIIKPLKKQGIKIDGIGLQSHFIIGEAPSAATQIQNMANFAALGLETAITELDIRSLNMPPTEDEMAQQVIDYNNTISACAVSPSCVGVTTWDFDDTYSWIPWAYPTQGYALPWFQPGGAGTPVKRKPGVYAALRTGFKAGWKK
ncbi:hypothetical protein ANO11243_020320 [Dothideomycetidae sp. 11243]|nr:hypothetical protein ANO11243_020320 [fungal sp. No.11243]